MQTFFLLIRDVAGSTLESLLRSHLHRSHLRPRIMHQTRTQARPAMRVLCGRQHENVLLVYACGRPSTKRKSEKKSLKLSPSPSVSYAQRSPFSLDCVRAVRRVYVCIDDARAHFH